MLIQAKIRAEMNYLLGIKKDDDFCKIRQPTKEEVDLFGDESGPGPSLKKMRPYFEELKCAWNNDLAEQFVVYFTTRLYPEVHFTMDDKLDIETMFMERLSRLKRKWSEMQAKDKAGGVAVRLQEKQQTLERQRANTRRLTVSDSESQQYLTCLPIQTVIQYETRHNHRKQTEQGREQR
jgi:hypothetical protein